MPTNELLQMNSALRYLLATSFRNAVLFRFKRLRQPKYLAGAIIGGLYFYFYFFKLLLGGGAPGSMSPGISLFPDPALATEIAAAVLGVAVMLLSWIMPASRAAINFSEAEISWLFPAPLKRSSLVIHKLLRSQLALLLLALFFTLFTGRYRAGSEAWLRMGGWWVILTTFSMHRIGASFALQRLRERGMADHTRRLIAVLGLTILLTLFEYWRRALPSASSFSRLLESGNFFRWFEQALHSGPAPILLTPFRIVVEPYFAHTAPDFLMALVPALVILAAHFWWVVRADVSFEDASVEAAKKRSALVAARSRGELRVSQGKARVPLFPLRSTGFVPVAFVWKFFIKVGGRTTIRRGALGLAVLAAIAWSLHAYQGEPTPLIFAGTMIVEVGCYLALFFSFMMVGQSAATQLRRGMVGMDLLKTYPIPGWHIALGELLGPLILGTLLQFIALAIASLPVLSMPDGQEAKYEHLLVAIGGIAIILPSLNLAIAILPCAAALLFPAWYKPQEQTAPGMEATGLRIIAVLSQLLALLIALLPAVFFGFAAWFALGKVHAHTNTQLLVSATTLSFVLALEASLGVRWLGRLYERYDVAEV